MEDWPLPTLREFGVLCTFRNILAAEQLFVRASCTVHRRDSTNRLAIATFWRTFHHDGKFSPACWGWGVHALSLFLLSTITSKVVVYALPERADTFLLFLLYPFFLCGTGTLRHGKRYGPPITVQIRSPPAKLDRPPCWIGSLWFFRLCGHESTHIMSWFGWACRASAWILPVLAGA